MEKILIVDDEELARELIETHLNQLPDFEIVAICASAIEASSVLKNETIDLLFLDIEMPVLKGTDFLKNLVHKPKVIFTTAHREYAIESYELNVVDYLLKPIVFNRFFKAIEKFLDTQTVVEATKKESELTHIFVQSNKKNIKVRPLSLRRIGQSRHMRSTCEERVVPKHQAPEKIYAFANFVCFFGCVSKKILMSL